MTTVYSRRWFQACLSAKKKLALITAFPSKNKRRSSYSNLRDVQQVPAGSPDSEVELVPGLG